MSSLVDRLTERVRGATVQGQLDRIRKLFVTYITDETIVPLKRVARFTVWGFLGSFFVAFGELLCLLGLLRYLQTLSWCHGHLSWVPYGLTTLAMVVVIALTARRVMTSSDVIRRRK
jgi:hypothetical protein